ncbi:LOW QUALITY PROTEIN: transcription elongation factor A protein-like 3 [Panthera uncia]|uniref:LOW QUALITY PROTEIN: transcription elongation factor A protein-like 3 n=1 Tax=Panthera uncia TaxID=29064 RepID=UPI0020FF9B7E|nr:LOW QUALITY PROTEIN: transcription elongation factor A protein-like 3 [Panthera uncia]
MGMRGRSGVGNRAWVTRRSRDRSGADVGSSPRARLLTHPAVRCLRCWLPSPAQNQLPELPGRRARGRRASASPRRRRPGPGPAGPAGRCEGGCCRRPRAGVEVDGRKSDEEEKLEVEGKPGHEGKLQNEGQPDDEGQAEDEGKQEKQGKSENEGKPHSEGKPESLAKAESESRAAEKRPAEDYVPRKAKRKTDRGTDDSPKDYQEDLQERHLGSEEMMRECGDVSSAQEELRKKQKMGGFHWMQRDVQDPFAQGGNGVSGE